MVLTGVLQRHPFTSCLQLGFGSAFAPDTFNDFLASEGKQTHFTLFSL